MCTPRRLPAMRRGSKVVGAVCPALAIAQMHGCETTAGQQVWVLQQLLGLADRCIGQAMGLKDLAHVRSAHCAKALAQLGQELGAQTHPVVVAGVARVSGRNASVDAAGDEVRLEGQ